MLFQTKNEMLIGNVVPKFRYRKDDKETFMMIRKWKFYMLGRLICGDDCLAQIFKNHEPTDRFRYQIQARDYNEGIVWGKICAREVFNTKKYYSYQKEDGMYNTIIQLTREDVNFLFEEKFIKTRIDSKRFKIKTALAVIKNIPLDKLLRFRKIEIMEFLAGCFDSDGSIRPKRSQMYISLDSQVGNRTDPLAYKQIELFKKWSEQNKIPKILKIEVVAPPHKIKRAKRFFSYIKNIFENTELKIYRNNTGVKIYMSFSCNVTFRSNREIWNLWIKEIAERLFRKDKRDKFLRFHKNRIEYFSLQKSSTRTLRNLGKKLGRLIDLNGCLLIKRPNHPQCEIRIKFLSLNEASKMKNNVEKILNCNASVFKNHQRYFVSFYISSKNYLEIKNFVLPHITTQRKRIKIKDYIDNRYARVAESLRLQSGNAHHKNWAESPAERESRGSKAKAEIPLPSFSKF